ncbi:MAG: hypothetical protein M1821_003933 [Bathelium mastoideum]|nr:MAG: hypothetical protein M1821_003933 [Bathelium mastoideum]
MASSSKPLPIVDISSFLLEDSPTSSRSLCVSELSAACRDVGFFYLTGHEIASSTTERVLSLARDFFLTTPESEKFQIIRKEPGDQYGDGARGYQRLGENITLGKSDFHEAVDFYYEDPACQQEGPPYQLLRGKNLWPKTPPELEPAFKDYLEQVKLVGTAVVRAMGAALNFGNEQEVFVDATRKSFWVMRMIGYPPLPKSPNGLHPNADEDDRQSCGTHTDYGCVTLLLADDTQGALQVRAKDGTWVNADPMPGAFIVNIGDMMETWTNGLWKSTAHRVVHRGDSFRVSVPFFFEPSWDAKVSPLQQCVKETGGQKKYDEVYYGDHLTAKVQSNFY